MQNPTHTFVIAGVIVTLQPYMKVAKNILVVFLLLLILIESIGIQIIRDVCLPCQRDSVAVQLVLSDYVSDCQDGCDSDVQPVWQHDKCCSASGCFDQEHGHQKEVKVMNQHPEFLRTNSLDTLINVSVSDVELNRLYCTQPVLQRFNKAFPFVQGLFGLPERNVHPFLCTFLL